jgi:hypothetical protein
MRVRQKITQASNDESILDPLSLPALDGKTAYSFTGIRVYWQDCQTVAAADWQVKVQLQSRETAAGVNNDEFIDAVAWAVQNTAGVAVAVPVEPFKEHFLSEPRVSVQPDIYLYGYSTGTAQANDWIVEVQFDIIKISELEYLRLLAGGA